MSAKVEHLAFSGHESFTLRHGWLKKGYDEVKRDVRAFAGSEAMVRLGVGKNMVASIRYWGDVCGMFSSAERGECAPTELGDAFLADEGWDPHLEDIGSVWWLHWRLARSRQAGACYWLFNKRRINRFDKEALVAEISDAAARTKSNRADESIRRDVDVALRSYERRSVADDSVGEEALESPFAALGLLRRAPDKKEFELVSGIHPTLPLRVFEAALVDYCSTPGRQSAVSLDDLLYQEGSPGRVFRLTEDGLLFRLRDLEVNSACYVVDEKAGLRQLLVRHQLPTATSVLAAHFTPPRSAA